MGLAKDYIAQYQTLCQRLDKPQSEDILENAATLDALTPEHRGASSNDVVQLGVNPLVVIDRWCHPQMQGKTGKNAIFAHIWGVIR